VAVLTVTIWLDFATIFTAGRNYTIAKIVLYNSEVV
jgi:hypothetical protein